MPLPDFEPGGHLPPGIHTASLTEVVLRFGAGAPSRQQQSELVERIVEAARGYATIKRVLLWGSFVTDKLEPADLDYSLVVAADHHRTPIAHTHRRFFVPIDARRYYGVDRSYLVIPDYPLDYYVGKLDFLCYNRDGLPCGIVEISLRGEFPRGLP
jgi:Family of unknown function (DUF6932)